MTSSFSLLINQVIDKVQQFFEGNRTQEYKKYDLWYQGMTGMGRQTERLEYICEENLEILMQWRCDVSLHWQELPESVKSMKRDEYNTLQLMIEGIISRMQMKVLLKKMEALIKHE